VARAKVDAVGMQEISVSHTLGMGEGRGVADVRGEGKRGRVGALGICVPRTLGKGDGGGVANARGKGDGGRVGTLGDMPPLAGGEGGCDGENVTTSHINLNGGICPSNHVDCAAFDQGLS
jgi:hypothetical protein